ncbi:MAG: hypothetical protein AABZ15_11615 [Nitrospirota bacterium]
MGADYPGQEKAIAILQTMPDAAKEYLAHHMRNALAGSIGNIDLAMRQATTPALKERLEKANDGLFHAVSDLARIGC